ncbi:unnamed protein product [Arabis nemorensis]|uniref:Uncharacterized protein n=1 Tax=Arabis nemorensis TaxID=586526 RepID=A0A565BHV0_9BRAS|nr:unnamed protein product [Arabis nemorensis]
MREPKIKRDNNYNNIDVKADGAINDAVQSTKFEENSLLSVFGKKVDPEKYIKSEEEKKLAIKDQIVEKEDVVMDDVVGCEPLEEGHILRISPEKVVPDNYIDSEEHKQLAATLMATPKRAGIDLLPRTDKEKFVLFHRTLTKFLDL